ncbi:MAG: hypothetical protein K2F79_08240, partial [Muribaculaceae bacterium]|nr:hypothetical protein [Muribaculaceae bacterium]
EQKTKEKMAKSGTGGSRRQPSPPSARRKAPRARAVASESRPKASPPPPKASPSPFLGGEADVARATGSTHRPEPVQTGAAGGRRLPEFPGGNLRNAILWAEILKTKF